MRQRYFLLTLAAMILGILNLTIDSVVIAACLGLTIILCWLTGHRFKGESPIPRCDHLRIRHMYLAAAFGMLALLIRGIWL